MSRFKFHIQILSLIFHHKIASYQLYSYLNYLCRCCCCCCCCYCFFLCAVRKLSKNSHKRFKSATVPSCKINFAISVLYKLEVKNFSGIVSIHDRFSWNKPHIFIMSSCDSCDFPLFPRPHCYPRSGWTKRSSRPQVPGADGNGGV